MVSSKLATLAELQSMYGTEDLYILLEVLIVDSHNQAAMNEARR